MGFQWSATNLREKQAEQKENVSLNFIKNLAYSWYVDRDANYNGRTRRPRTTFYAK